MTADDRGTRIDNVCVRSFGLLSDPVPPPAMRSLVMIAKCLQNLANLVEFGGKEPYMEEVNPFILKNKERMVVFLDHLSSVRDKPYPDEDRVKVSLMTIFSPLYRVLRVTLPGTWQLSTTSVSLTSRSWSTSAGRCPRSRPW